MHDAAALSEQEGGVVKGVARGEFVFFSLRLTLCGPHGLGKAPRGWFRQPSVHCVQGIKLDKGILPNLKVSLFLGAEVRSDVCGEYAFKRPASQRRRERRKTS